MKFIGHYELSSPVIDSILYDLEYIKTVADLSYIEDNKIQADVLHLVYDFFRDIDIVEEEKDFAQRKTSTSDSEIDFDKFVNRDPYETSESEDLSDFDLDNNFNWSFWV